MNEMILQQLGPLVQQLILIRLAASPRNPPTPKRLRESLATLIGHKLREAELARLQEQLTQKGYLYRTPRKAYRLTDSGRQQALRFLRIRQFPPSCRWNILCTRYLFPALVDLWVKSTQNPSSVPILDDLSTVTADGITPLDATPADATTATYDLPRFADAVRKLAAASPQASRFGQHKVFISALWQQSQADPSFPRMSLDQFKQQLVEANRQGLLQLSRADLVQVMNPTLVAESETHYLGCTFHFVSLRDITS